MKSLYGLLGLPQELRDLIWDLLAEEEDFTPLIQTCRQLRTEILARMPGGEYFDYGQPHDEKLPRRLRFYIHTRKVTIIAEPWYSSGSALKIEVQWLKKWYKKGEGPDDTIKTARWTIRDLSSPMARYIYWYQLYRLHIAFEAPTQGHMVLALLILRAKVFDICRILKNMLTMDCSSCRWKVKIYFRGGKDPSRPWLPRKSFWEMRPGLLVSRGMFVGTDGTGRKPRGGTSVGNPSPISTSA